MAKFSFTRINFRVSHTFITGIFTQLTNINVSHSRAHVTNQRGRAFHANYKLDFQQNQHQHQHLKVARAATTLPI